MPARSGGRQIAYYLSDRECSAFAVLSFYQPPLVRVALLSIVPRIGRVNVASGTQHAA
jgi:hypothetical protein